MTILVISDIHANSTALKRVIDDAGPVEAVWCLGDLVGYGPDPNECIEIVRSMPNTICLLGNHDAAVAGALDVNGFNREAQLSIQYVQQTIHPENLAWLSDLQDRWVTGDVTLVHGSPRNPIWEYLLDIYTVAASFRAFQTAICLVGHTHVQIQYMQNGDGQVSWRVPAVNTPIILTDRTILNPGSVGQPRDHDPRAAYALFDPAENQWIPRRVAYDIEAVQARIQKVGLPVRHAVRLAEGW